eukprot:5422773-Prymnesium_polylepis.1
MDSVCAHAGAAPLTLTLNPHPQPSPSTLTLNPSSRPRLLPARACRPDQGLPHRHDRGRLRRGRLGEL